MFNNQILAGSSGQGGITQQSLKFNDDESQYLSWTPAVAGNRQTWTWSGWFKRANLSATEMDLFSAGNSSTDRFEVILSSAYPDQLEIYMNTSGTVGDLVTTQVFRDVSAWYHLVIAFDTTQATASNRVKIYVNGSQVTAFNTATYPSLNFNTAVNSTSGQFFSKRSYVDDRYYDGYLADVYMIDGQALDPTDFGQFTNGYWEAIDYAGSYGTNGFHLTFQDDVVSEGFNATTYLATEANQSISGIGFSPDLVIVKNRDSSSNARWGVIDSVRGVNKTLATDITDVEVTSRSDLLTSFDADGFSLGADAAAYGWNNQTYTAGDRQVAWCWDAGDVTSIVTNGDFSNGTTGWTANNCTASVNSDGRLSATFVSSGAYVYQLLTTVVGQTYAITYNNYQAADFVFAHATSPTGTQIASSNSSGTAPILFTATTTTTSIRFDIPNSQTRIIDDVQVFEANTDGSITSTVKANPSYGFSIVSYTGASTQGATFGHGLGVAPDVVIAKARTGAQNWWVYHSSLGYTKNTVLNLTSASATDNNTWLADPTSSLVTIGDNFASSIDYIAYCFAEVAGYSSIGSFTGTGADHLSEQTLGFRPAFVLVKDSTSAGDPWVIFDNTRDTDGTLNNLLFPNSSGAEVSSSVTKLEISDTGFTVKGTGTAHNNNGSTIIYAAFTDSREAAFWKDVSGQGNHWTPSGLD